MREFTPYEENVALAWATACLEKYDRENPDASLDDRVKAFRDAVEGGFALVLDDFKLSD